MVRWRLVLVLAVLLMLPARISSKGDDDDDEEEKHGGDDAEEEEDEDDEEEEDEPEKPEKAPPAAAARESASGGEGDIPPAKPNRRGPAKPAKADKSETRKSAPGGGGGGPPGMAAGPPGGGHAGPGSLAAHGGGDMKPAKKRPLECYVCAYKSETPLRACLDPTKFRVHTITCHNVEDRCFTSVIAKEHSDTYEAVVRGCRSGCIGTTETTCCETSRCNSQAYAMPVVQHALTEGKTTGSGNKYMPNNIVFFVTILLVLQTVVKVAFV